MRRKVAIVLGLALLGLSGAWAQVGTFPVTTILKTNADCDVLTCTTSGQVCITGTTIYCCNTGAGNFDACGSAGGGVTTFLGLTDAPDSYAGQSLKLLRINAGETGIEFTSAGASLTVEEADLSPSVTSVDTIQFDQADGFVVTDETGGNVQVDLAAVPDTALASSYSGTGACGLNTFASTLNDNAAPTCTQPSFSNLSGAATDAQVPNTITIDLAGTATALAADPADCSGNNFALGIAASGAAACAQPAFANLSGTAAKSQLPAAVAYEDEANTYTSGLQTFGAGAHASAGVMSVADGNTFSYEGQSGNTTFNRDPDLAALIATIDGTVAMRLFDDQLDPPECPTDESTVAFGRLCKDTANGDLVFHDKHGVRAIPLPEGGGAGVGDVVGPPSSLNAEIALFEGVTGNLLAGSGVTWNVTAATCTGDGNGGALTINGSNEVICSPDDGGAGGGDNIQVEDSDNGGTFTAATNVDFEDSGDINFVLDTTPSPDQITGIIRANSVALTTDTTGNYAAGDGEAGAALTGDSATAFFAAGQVEAARGGTGADTSASTGVPRISAGTWTADAGISHLASSTSASLAAVLSDETGSGAACFATNPALAGDPTAPTAGANDSDTSIATTAYVQGEISGAGGRSLACASGSCDADAELYTHTKCMVIEAPVDADNLLFYRVEAASTVTGIDCLVNAATSAIMTVQECNSNGASCTTTEAAMTCGTTNTTESAGIDDAAWDATDWIRVDVGTVSGTPGHLAVCVTFTVND